MKMYLYRVFWIVSSLILFLIDFTEAYRYYYYRYYSYYYTYYYYSGSYYSYYGYLTSSEKGIVAGGVIGGLVVIFAFSACVVYCCVYSGRRTSGRTIGTTISTVPAAGPANVPYPPTYTADGKPTAYSVTTTNTAYGQPPPPYDVNVDSRSRTNLVENEVHT